MSKNALGAVSDKAETGLGAGRLGAGRWGRQGGLKGELEGHVQDRSLIWEEGGEALMGWKAVMSFMLSKSPLDALQEIAYVRGSRALKLSEDRGGKWTV